MEFEEYPIKLSYEDLQAYTDNFSDKNYIGNFQFGKVYHGKITLSDSAKPKLVTIKIWRIPELYAYYENDNAHRLMDELSFLETIDHSYPGFMKLYGYCIKPEQCGIVYDFKSYNTVFNLATTDEFTWSKRIKVALRLAQILRYVHVNYKGQSPLVIRNVNVAHVMVDEDWNPTLYDFGMISGGMFPNKLQFPIEHVEHCHGCNDQYGDNQKTDVYAFGIVLLSLIMKEVYTDEDRKKNRHEIPDRAYFKKESKFKYENFHFSLVHKSLEADGSFYWRDGPTITRLALSCFAFHPAYRPTMNQVVNQLQKLHVVRRQPQLSVYIEGIERMKKEVKREDIAYGKRIKENIRSRKMGVKREDIAYGKKIKENIPSRKMGVKGENIASRKAKVKKENISSGKEDIASGEVKVKTENFSSQNITLK